MGLVHRLAELLASQEAYLGALSAWDEYRATTRGDNHRVDAAVKSALALGPKPGLEPGAPAQPDAGPPLERLADNRYRWRYDYAGALASVLGTAVQPPRGRPHVSSAVAATPPTQSRAAAAATEHRAGKDDAWLASLQVIRRFEVVLRQEERVKVGEEELLQNISVNVFKVYAETWNVIPTTPAPLEVGRAVERLLESRSKGRRHGNYDRDADVVEQFAVMLCRNAETLANALFCDAALGRAAMLHTQSPRLGVGLAAISEAYRLRKKDETEVLAVFRSLASKLRDRFRVLRGTDLTFAPVTDELTFDDWATAVGSMLRPVKELKFLDENIDEIGHLAWGSVKQRVVEYLALRDSAGASPGTSVPTVDELLTHVAAIRPGNLIPFDLDTMTLDAWGAAFRYAVQDVSPESENHCPAWMAIAALRALGFTLAPPSLSFWETSRKHYKKRPDNEFLVLHEDATTGLWAATVFPFAAAIVITRSSNSVVESWRPDPRFAVIPLSLKELREIPLHVWQIPLNPPLGRVIMEMPANIEDALQDVPHVGPTIRLFAREPKRDVERLPSDIIAPRNIADLFPDFRAMAR